MALLVEAADALVAGNLVPPDSESLCELCTVSALMHHTSDGCEQADFMSSKGQRTGGDARAREEELARHPSVLLGRVIHLKRLTERWLNRPLAA